MYGNDLQPGHDVVKIVLQSGWGALKHHHDARESANNSWDFGDGCFHGDTFECVWGWGGGGALKVVAFNCLQGFVFLMK